MNEEYDIMKSQKMCNYTKKEMPDQYDCVDIKNGVKVLKSAENPNHPSLPDIHTLKVLKFISR